jgi:hypothetical protein
VSTDVGVSHCPRGTNVWLYVSGVGVRHVVNVEHQLRLRVSDPHDLRDAKIDLVDAILE